MPVQAKSILHIMAGRDVMAQSSHRQRQDRSVSTAAARKLNLLQNEVQALVLVPTRELAAQVGREANVLGRSAGMRNGCFVRRRRLRQSICRSQIRRTSDCRHTGASSTTSCAAR